jgi:hypothetical protein
METLLNIIRNDLNTLQIDGQIFDNNRESISFHLFKYFDLISFINRFMHRIQFVHFVVINDL